jgi:hypothetical protein
MSYYSDASLAMGSASFELQLTKAPSVLARI